MIPHRVFRVVPQHTTNQVEKWWNHIRDLHPQWEHTTLRAPLDTTDYPITAPLWPTCQTGAQWADLVRFEELWMRGGVYLDSDMELWRPLDNLTGCELFAAWEDTCRVCNAVIGAQPHHQAIGETLDLAVKRHHQGTEAAGVQAFTDVMRHHPETTLLPPDTFYPVHWRDADKVTAKIPLIALYPWVYGVHYWAKSWLATATA